jgi:type VI secretion system lysozyme-like protein
MDGSRVLLFDRLVDENPGEKKELRSYRVLDREGLIQSVQRELARLLNTRRTSSAVLDPTTATVLDYGIPDFSSLSAASPTDRQQLASLISSAIAAFEPRLASVRVELSPSILDHRAVDGVISGLLKIGPLMEPIAFPVLLHRESGAIEILAAPQLGDASKETQKQLPL